MRRAVRAIVIKDDQLLVIHRNKFGKEYDTLPGGNIEIGEAPEAALVREIDEETQITIRNPRPVFVEHAGEPYGDQFVYLCDYATGEAKLKPGAEEDLINQMGQNLYEPRWLPLQELPAKPFISERLKQAILQGVAHGWPETPVELE